jgi:hypothetical protein
MGQNQTEQGSTKPMSLALTAMEIRAALDSLR